MPVSFGAQDVTKNPHLSRIRCFSGGGPASIAITSFGRTVMYAGCAKGSRMYINQGFDMVPKVTGLLGREKTSYTSREQY